jgi:CBS-domain-containing membrane protein
MKTLKANFLKAVIAGICSAGTIGILAVLTYKTTFGIFLAASFGSSMVLLFAFPESPFAQPKNVFFGHLLTALVGVVFAQYIALPMYVNISVAVGVGIFLMILFNVVHPPAGGNPIMVIVAGVSYEYLINPIILGSFIMLALAIVINKFVLKKNYPVR